MIARTYYVELPGAEGGSVSLDIVPEAYPGTQDNPIDSGNSPAGWIGADGGGSYYEIRGRSLRFPTGHAGDNGFVPLLNLGMLVSVTRYNDTAHDTVPSIQLSASFQSALNATPLVDPDYGPVIRLTGLSADVDSATFLVTLFVMQAKDEDRTSTGT